MVSRKKRNTLADDENTILQFFEDGDEAALEAATNCWITFAMYNRALPTGQRFESLWLREGRRFYEKHPPNALPRHVHQLIDTFGKPEGC